MKKLFLFSTLVFLLSSCATSKKSDGWISLFNGKSLDGWKISENPATFSVENGTIYEVTVLWASDITQRALSQT